MVPAAAQTRCQVASQAPYSWSVEYQRRGLGEGEFDTGPKQTVRVSMDVQWAMMNGSNKKPEVTMLQGTLRRVVTQGRKETDREEEAGKNVEFTENGEGFERERAMGEQFALKGTKVKAKAPKMTPEDAVRSCG